MKRKLLSLALVLAIAMSLSIPIPALAADEDSNTLGLPAGTYTYVDTAPVAEDDGTGQVQFLYAEDCLVWTIGTESGTEILASDTLKFFQGIYFSDRPVTDWFGSAEKDTEGYLGDVAGNLDITFGEDGKISYLNVTSPTTRVMAVLSSAITDKTLTVQGSTRGQPKLMQSCITLIGSTNALYLTVQGDVILDGLTIGNDGAGNGLSSDKIGGDTFVVGSVTVDGTIEWHNKMGVITALSTEPGILETNGYDISMTGGSNIGRVGRNLTISTGSDKAGDIMIGTYVTTDATRGGLLPNADTSSDGVTISTSGSLIAGLGDVVIGTNDEKAVNIDIVGNIQGANVTIQPVNYGEVASVNGSIGSITANGDITVTVGSIAGETSATSVISSSEGTMEFEVSSGSSGNAAGILIGNLTALNGNIALVTGEISGGIGTVSAPNGTVSLDVAYANNVTFASVPVTVDGALTTLTGYNIAGNHYFRPADLTSLLSANVTAAECIVDGVSYYKLRDVLQILDYAVEWNGATITIRTTGSYSA